MYTALVSIGGLLVVAPALAQDDVDMTFSPEDLGGDPAGEGEGTGTDEFGTGAGDDEGGTMEFGVIDTEAAAKEVERDRRAEIDLIRVIQRRPFLRRNRVEVSPFVGTNINDALVSLFVAGGSLNYHLTEVMSVGVNGGYSLGTETDLFDRVIEDYELFPQISKIKWYATLNFQYAFIYGKFALFNTWIIPWDTYALLGAGFTQTELDGHLTISAGIGQRYFMNRWFTLNLELRDNVYNENYPAGSEIVNNLMFTAGVSFFIPPDFEYRTLK
ncbi:MAG: outer membrane beta-barrel domain-containing protein [Myxococcales bacterium]|nr:outer membrane beta-barrel domain-containing protein [Myxococcales bacterium]